MLEYSNILFCTDFSHNSDVAFEEALCIAKLTGASLSLLHVMHGGVGESAARALPSEQKELEDAALLARLARSYPSGEVDASHMAVRRGNVTAEILDHAVETKASVIVIGARGIGRLEGFLSGGSIAERVARNTEIPVMIVGTPSHGRR